MTFQTTLRGALAAASVIAAFAASDVHARNVQYMIAVAEPLAAARTSDGVADVDFAFGSASSKGADIVGGAVNVQGVASPYAEAHGFKPTDDETCRLAVRDALKRLAVLARAAGGHAVVGIVSSYNGATVDDPAKVECRLGASKVLAPLSGVVAKTLPAVAP